MTLKKSVAINIALAFSILFGLISVIIFFLFSTFRNEEFRERLEEKALTTARLLVEVKEVDKQLLKLIDQNTINKLYNEKTLVFDKNFNLLYSSIDDAFINWNMEDLRRLKVKKSFYSSEKEKDVLGIHYDYDGVDYYILIAAEDKYGNSKLRYLLFLLIISFLSSVIIIWGSAYFIIKKLLKPLDNFEKQITNISANELNLQLRETGESDEINLLTKAFNKMLQRIDASFAAQQEFTSNASHELRTPLTRLAFQLENLIKSEKHSDNTLAYLNAMLLNVHQLSDLVNSLLLLSKVNRDDFHSGLKPQRIDEIIFTAYKHVKGLYPGFELRFEIQEKDGLDSNIEINGIRHLLEIVFINLLKNACMYSDDKCAHVLIHHFTEQNINVMICNNGPVLDADEQSTLFKAFVRGRNASNTYGSGLGLRMVKRILEYHGAEIEYGLHESGMNQFTIHFKI